MEICKKERCTRCGQIKKGCRSSTLQQPISLCVMIFVSVFDKKRYRYSQSHDLRCGNSQPYAVYSQDKWEYQHGYYLEKQRSQERYGCGDRSVSDRKSVV